MEFPDKYEINKKVLRYQYSEKDSFLLFYPTSLQLEISSKCNLRCELCGRRVIKQERIFFPLEYLKALSPFIDNIEKILLGGYGEPFTNPDIFEFLDYFEKKGKKIELITNGSFLEKEDIRRLGSYKNLLVTVSLDETPENRDFRFRNVDPSVIIANLQALRANRVKLALHSLATLNNLEELPRIAGLAAELEAEYLKIINPHIFRKEYAYLSIFNDFSKTEKCFEALLNFSLNKSVKIILPSLKLFKKTHCYQPFETLLIRADLTVKPCCNLIFDNLSSLTVGNLKNQNLSEIWNSPKIIYLRKCLYSLKLEGLSCNTCSFRDNTPSNFMKY